MSGQGYEQLTLCLEGFPVNRSPLPGSGEARMMTASSGRRCLGLLVKSSPLGSLAKMLLESSIWGSTMCLLTWKAKATKQGRLYFQLAVSVPRTGGTGSQLWATPNTKDHLPQRSPESTQAMLMRSRKKRVSNLREQVGTGDMRLWPTPTVPNGGRSVASVTDWRSPQTAYKNGKKVQVDLNAAVKMWPTPRANDSKKAGNCANESRNGLPAAVLYPTPRANSATGASWAEGRQGGSDLQTTVAEPGRMLSAAWVTRLMGFPDGWLDL